MIKHKEMTWTIIGVTFIVLLMTGCSTRLQTRVVSKDTPPKKEVVKLEEPMEASKIPLNEFEIASKTTEEDSALDLPIEPPPQPVLREQLSQPIFAAPQELPGDKDQSVGSKRNEVSDEAKSLASTVIPEESISKTEGTVPLLDFVPELPPIPSKREIVEIPKVSVPPELSESNTKIQPANLKNIQEESQPGPMEVAKLAPSNSELSSVETKKELLEALKDVYFDYDRFGLRREAIPELEANAELLASHMAGRTIVLQGHCDERGTESYNMVLGKRRARAVKEVLVDLGVPDENLHVVSFGKEKPFCTQQTLQCWQENRRVHFVVQ